MKIYALISFDVPDDEMRNIPQKIDLVKNNIENYGILKVISKSDITFDDCRFPYKLKDLLKTSGIKKVADLEQYTLQRLVRLFIRRGIKERDRTKYLECIVYTLKALGLSLSQNSEDNLIKLNDCNLSPQMLKKLNNAGYYYLQDIADSSKFRVSQIRGINSSGQHIIEDKLEEYGLWYAG